MIEPAKQQFPAAALVETLKGRTIVDASCDGEGVDDVHLLLDDGTTVFIDTELDESANALETAKKLGTPERRWPQLTVWIGSRKHWPHDGSDEDV